MNPLEALTNAFNDPRWSLVDTSLDLAGMGLKTAAGETINTMGDLLNSQAGGAVDRILPGNPAQGLGAGIQAGGQTIASTAGPENQRKASTAAAPTAQKGEAASSGTATAPESNQETSTPAEASSTESTGNEGTSGGTPEETSDPAPDDPTAPIIERDPDLNITVEEMEGMTGERKKQIAIKQRRETERLKYITKLEQMGVKIDPDASYFDARKKLVNEIQKRNKKKGPGKKLTEDQKASMESTVSREAPKGVSEKYADAARRAEEYEINRIMMEKNIGYNAARAIRAMESGTGYGRAVTMEGDALAKQRREAGPQRPGTNTTRGGVGSELSHEILNSLLPTN